MKKALCTLLAIIFCLSFTQCKSNEEKADELIKDYMFKNLPDFESYEPIETKIDSAFYTIYNDSTTIKYASILLDYEEKFSNLHLKHTINKTSMDIWCKGIYTRYSRNKCKDCLKDVIDNLNEMLHYGTNMVAYMDTINFISDTINKKFIGWQVSHDFRCRTKEGGSDICHYIFVMDKKIKTIQSQINLDDKKDNKINSIIKQCIEMNESQRAEYKETFKEYRSVIDDYNEQLQRIQ